MVAKIPDVSFELTFLKPQTDFEDIFRIGGI